MKEKQPVGSPLNTFRNGKSGLRYYFSSPRISIKSMCFHCAVLRQPMFSVKSLGPSFAMGRLEYYISPVDTAPCFPHCY